MDDWTIQFLENEAGFLEDDDKAALAAAVLVGIELAIFAVRRWEPFESIEGYLVVGPIFQPQRSSMNYDNGAWRQLPSIGLDT